MARYRKIRDAGGPLDCPEVDDMQVNGTLTLKGAVVQDTAAGTVGAATVTATEYGNGARDYLTVLTLTAFSIGTIADNAAKAFGSKIFTWPTGCDVLVSWTSIDGSVTVSADVTTDTPEVGIGNVVASGANATLSTATWENLVDGGASGSTIDVASVAPDCAGTAFRKKSLNTTTPIIKSAGTRDLFLNVAATWANVDLVGPPVYTGALTFTGTIILKWFKVN